MPRRALWLLLLIACQPGDSTLTLSPSPRNIDDKGQASTLKIFAVDPMGNPGTGSVKVTSAAGSLVSPETVTLAAGAAEVGFTCAVAQDPNCMGRVRVVGEWATGGQVVGTSTTVTVGAGGGGGGTGGAGGAGGNQSTFDVGEVLLLGSMSMGTNGDFSIAPVLRPLDTTVGFPQDMQRNHESFSHFVLRSGKIAYYFFDELRVLASEPPGEMNVAGKNFWTYPVNPEANDMVIPRPGCMADNMHRQSWANPENDDLLNFCVGDQYRIEGVDITASLQGGTPASFGYGRNIMVEGCSIALGDGGFIASPMPGCTALRRATPTGFLVGISGSGCELYEISYDGVPTRLGGYPNVGDAGTACRKEDRLAGDNTLYSYGALVGASATIIKRPLNGTTWAPAYDVRFGLDAGYNFPGSVTHQVFTFGGAMLTAP